MNILVASASRHGSTRELADVIPEELRASSHVTDVLDAAKPGSIKPYDAAIIGSAVYMGKWLPEARDFVERNRQQLSEVPVWFFSSGPLGDGDPPTPGGLLTS